MAWQRTGRGAFVQKEGAKTAGLRETELGKVITEVPNQCSGHRPHVKSGNRGFRNEQPIPIPPEPGQTPQVADALGRAAQRPHR